MTNPILNVTEIQLRRDVPSSWTDINPILAEGEPGVELGNPSRLKIGDGKTHWVDLPYNNAVVDTTGLAPIDSPHFTGTPTAPVPSAGVSGALAVMRPVSPQVRGSTLSTTAPSGSPVVMTVALPSSMKPGDDLYVAIATATTITVPTGYTLADPTPPTSGDAKLYVLHRVVTGTEGSSVGVQLGANTQTVGGAVALVGGTGGTPVHAEATGSVGSVNLTVGANAQGSVLAFQAGADASHIVGTPPTSFTKLQDGWAQFDFRQLSISVAQAATNGSYGGVFSVSPNAAMAIVLIPVASARTSAVTADQVTSSGVQATDIGGINTTQIGAANGVASLDANRQVPATQLSNTPGTAVSTPAWTTFQDPGVGGRVVKVHISKYDPNRIYVSGDMLGLAVSTDGGQTFTGGIGLPSWEMASFTEHPTDPLTVWCGSMSGPVVSHDGGQTWTLKRSGFPATSGGAYTAPVEKILFDPANPKHLLAFGGSFRIWRYASQGGVSNYGVIWESVDSGNTWTKKTDLGNTTGLTTNSNIMWATAKSDWSTIYIQTQHYGPLKSTDQGATWTQLPTGLPHLEGGNIIIANDGTTLFSTLQAGPTGPTFQAGGVYRSTNDGATWSLSGTGQPQLTSTIQSWTTQVESVHQTADGTLWFGDQNQAGGHNNEWHKSVDGGNTWTLVAPTINRFFPGPLNVHAFTSDPNNANVIWGGTNDGFVYSTNAGQTWSDGGDLITGAGAKRGRGYSGILGVRVTFNRWRKGWVAVNGFDSGNLNLTKDGGQSWSGPIWSIWDFYTGGYDTAFGGPTGNIIYTLLGQAGIFNGVLVSQDAGVTWSAKVGGTFPSRNANLGGGYQNGVEIVSADGSTCLVAYGGTLYKTTNFGSTWNTVAGLSPSDVATTLDYSTIVTVSPNQNPRVSTDGGVTWTADTTAVHLTRVVASPDGSFWGVGYNAKYGGTVNSGVWHRPAGSGAQAWTQMYSGTWAWECEDIAVDPYDASHIVTVTDQNPFNDISTAGGVLESKDAGVTWTQRNTNLPMTRAMSVAFDPWEYGRVVIGLDGRGYWTAKMFGVNTPQDLHSGIASTEGVPGLRSELRRIQNILDTFTPSQTILNGSTISGDPTGVGQFLQATSLNPKTLGWATPTPFNPRSAWSSNNTYNLNDYVGRLGGSYLALTNGLTSDPVIDTGNWMQVTAPPQVFTSQKQLYRTGAKVASTVASATSASITVPPGGHLVGNTLVLGACMSQGVTITSITDSRGNTWVVDVNQTNGSNSSNLAHSVLTTGLQAGDTITIHTSAGTNVILAEYIECINITSTDGVSSAIDNSVTVGSAGSVTPTMAGDLAIAVWSFSATGTLSAGFTLLDQFTATGTGQTRTMTWAISPRGDLSTITPTYTASVSTSGQGVLAVYK